MNSNCGVYCIRCKVNNKAYIGSSVNINRRWTEHKSALKAGRHDNKQLQEDYNKYGADNFLYLTLINCKPQNLLWYENIYMLLFNTRDISMGYNMLRAARPPQTWESPPKLRELYKVQCIETGEVVTKREVCSSGKEYTRLNNHLQGKRQSYRGYHWRYVD